MTSFMAAGGSGRSASVIPAVPAAWSVTTIAFILDTSLDRSSPPRCVDDAVDELAGAGLPIDAAPVFSGCDSAVGTRRFVGDHVVTAENLITRALADMTSPRAGTTSASTGREWKPGW